MNPFQTLALILVPSIEGLNICKGQLCLDISKGSSESVSVSASYPMEWGWAAIAFGTAMINSDIYVMWMEDGML